MAVIYVLAIFAISQVLFPAHRVEVSQSFVYLAMALILALTFQQLRRFFERITERVFYRDHYDSQVVLNNFTQILVSELDLNRILKKALTTLCDSLRIQFGQIIVFNNDSVYRIEHYGPLPHRLMVAPELRRLNRSILVADELEGGERKSLLEGHGVRISMMLSTHDQFVGYFLLGDKLSGDIYSNQDIALLEIIRNELAVAILNAKAYAEIQAFNASLQARVDHATNRLRVANRHLKELDKAKDEFISMASHQLRTPLTTIKGYLSMMLEGDAGPISPGQKEFAQFAFDSSERMVNLISDLLNISRLNAGRFLIQRTPTDMVQMIEDEVRQATQHADGKGLKLVFDRPDHPLPPVEIDENKTRQVVMNFIDNAIYYTQKGEVRVVLKQTGDMVHLEVHDTGIGVPEQARRKLFTKFYRAENAQIVRPDGTGLGLYLAKRVIQDQDGTIIFNSVEGKGSTFGFELPFKPKPVKHEDTKHAQSH
ncbi:MAG TPA: HAMP domain-containing sensor histidine kinase [Candidatus Saccharimonadia bacterium]